MTLLKFCLFLGGLFVGLGQLMAQITTTTSRNTTLPKNEPTGIVKVSEIKERYHATFEFINSHQKGNHPKDSYFHHLLELKEQQDKRYGRPQNELVPNSAAGEAGLQIQSDGRPPLTASPSPSIEVGNRHVVVLESEQLLHVFQNDGSFQKTIPLSAFRDAVQVPSDLFSPHIRYDSEQQRYVLSFMAGRKADNSNLIIAFSITDDPLGNWVVYKYDVNSFQEQLYGASCEMIIGKNELFITVDMVETYPNRSWIKNQYETRIFQIQKAEGYRAKPLLGKVWRDMIYGDLRLKHLFPVRAGIGHYGPQAYFIATQGGRLRGDSLFFITLTNSLKGEDAEINFQLLRMPLEYQMPNFAAQRTRNTPLQTSGTRVQSAYFHLNQIHFVCSSIDPSTSRTAIYHGVLDSIFKDTLSTRAYYISDPSYYLDYPSIVYAGTGVHDTLSLIFCHHTASNMYPGLSAFFFRDSYKRPYHSSLNYLKAGQQSIEAPKGSRLAPWSGGSGACRIPEDYQTEPSNRTALIWVVGCYGNLEQRNQTWLANLSNRPLAGPRPKPTPFYEQKKRVTLSVEVPEDDRNLRVVLVREDGVVEKLFFKGVVERSGEARFSCFVDDLPAGTYQLVVESSEDILEQEEIIIRPGSN